MRIRSNYTIPVMSIMMVLTACDCGNNILLGRVEADAGGRRVVVTDCYRTKVPGVEKLAGGTDGKPVYRFKPCADAEVIIRGDDLVVNGKGYGKIGISDKVTVDHGRVLVNDRPAVAD